MQVVREEQRRALLALVAHCPIGDSKLCLPSPGSLSADQVRLISLATQVLEHAAAKADAECRRILATAEVEAHAIVRQAEEDLDRMTELFQLAAVEDPIPTSPQPPTARRANTPPQPIPVPAAVVVHRADVQETVDKDDAESDFFAARPADEEDRWSFMEDDNSGVPGLVRWLFRKPSTARGLDR